MSSILNSYNVSPQLLPQQLGGSGLIPGSASALTQPGPQSGGGLNMGPSADSLSTGNNLFSNALSQDPTSMMGGSSGMSGGLSQLIPQLLSMMSAMLNLVMSLLQSGGLGGSGGQGGQGSASGGSTGSDPTAGMMPSPAGGASPTGGTPATDSSGTPSPGAASPSPGMSCPSSPTGAPSPTATPSSAYSVNSPTGVPSPGATPTPTGSDPSTGANPSPGGAPTASPSGGNSDYVNHMISALKACGAPDSLIDAYKHQYQLLGLMPADGSSPSPSPTSAGGTPTPTGSGAVTPTAGSPPTPYNGAPTPSPSSGPTPATSPSSGLTPSPTPSTGQTPTPTSTAGPVAPSGPVSQYPGSGKVNWDKAPTFIKKWQSQIQAAAQKTGMPESLIAAMITDESSGNENAITTNQDPTSSGDDAKDVGLLQVDGKTYKKEIQPKHRDLPADQMARYQPDVNVLAGAYYISDLPFGSWQAKLRAYNSGPTHVDPNNPDSIKPDDKGLAPGTVGYPTKILGLASRLEQGTLNW